MKIIYIDIGKEISTILGDKLEIEKFKDIVKKRLKTLKDNETLAIDFFRVIFMKIAFINRAINPLFENNFKGELIFIIAKSL